MIHRLHFLILAITAIMMFFSCKDPAYDLRDIDTTIQVGGDSLALPIGSTDTIRLNQFIDLDQMGFLMILADGSYGIRMRDSVDVDVPTLDASSLRIDDISVNEETSIPLSEINFDELQVPEIAITDRIDIPLPSINVSGISIPGVNTSTKSRVGLYDVYRDVTDAAAGMPIPEDQAVTVPLIEKGFSLEEAFTFSTGPLDEQIKSLQTIHLTNESAITLTLKKTNFENLAGVDITLDSIWVVLPSICQLSHGGSEHLELNRAFSGSSLIVTIPLKSFDLSGLTVSPSGIDFTDDIRVRIRYRCEGEATYGQLPTEERMDAEIDMTCESNIVTRDVTVETNTISQDLPRAVMPITLANTFDPMIKHLGRIGVSNTRLSINIVMPVLPMTPKSSPEGIQIKFPQWIEFQSNPNLSTDNIFTIKGDIPSQIELGIEALELNLDLDEGSFEITDSIVMSGALDFLSQEINSSVLDGSTRQLSLQAHIPAIQISEIELGSLRAEIDESVSFSLNQTDFPQEVYSLDSIFFDNGDVTFSIEVAELPDFGNQLHAKIALDFPDELIFTAGQVEAGNILKIDRPLADNKLNVTVTLRGITFDGQPLNGTLAKDFAISMEGGFSIDNPTIKVDEIRGKNAKVITTGAISGLSLSHVYGKINPQIDPQTISIAFPDMPEMLKGDSVVLDFDNPHLALEAISNLGIPIKAEANINPYLSGQILNEGRQEVSFSIPRSANAQSNAVAKYWIAKNSEGMPSDYAFKMSPLSTLIRRLPDSIQFRVLVQSDLAQQHEFDVNATYRAKLRYDLVVPLAFGPDLKIILQDTIGDLPSIVGELLNGNRVEITGEVANTLPLDLEMLVIPIDPNYHVIPIEPARQTIKAGKANGSETLTKLTLSIADPQGMVGDLHGFILFFTAKTGSESSGVPITEQSYVRAKLGVKIPGGFTFKP